MVESVPLVQEAEIPLSAEELEVLRKQFEREGEFVTIQTKFNYAWGLIKSTDSAQVKVGIGLLTDIYSDSPERRRECLYYLALAHNKLGNYTEARDLVRRLIRLEPTNTQALALGKLIDEKVSREGIIGLAIVSGALVVGAALVAVIIMKRSSK